MDSIEFEYKLQSVLLVVEAVAYLGLAGWCLSRSREGRWANVVAVGAALVGAVLGVSALASFEQIFLHSGHIYEQVFFHRHVPIVLTATRFAGVLLLMAGFVQSRRTPTAASAGSIYGP